MNPNNTKLTLPAIRGVMGDWIYYVCLMKMRDVAMRISAASEIHKSQSLKDMLQRNLSERSIDISNYLLTQPQRFFNALVVGTYGGNPNWFELSINVEGSAIYPLPEYFEGLLGILELNEAEKLWAIDGQHRVFGIKKAIEQNPELGEEEVCVIFVAGVADDSRDKDPGGYERTRRLFTTLNRYAKPVSKTDIIGLDEDDIIAIITRNLFDNHRLIQDHVAVLQKRSISSDDTQNFTTIVVLYDVLDIILRDQDNRRWNKFKTKRPPDNILDQYYGSAIIFLDLMIEAFPVLQEYLANEDRVQAARNFRNNNGGHLLFRPIGLLLVTKVIRLLIDKANRTLEDAISLTKDAPMDISGEPWANLLWDIENRRMLTSPENQRIARLLLYYMVGGDLDNIGSSFEKVSREYAGILNLDLITIDLTRFRI